MLLRNDQDGFEVFDLLVLVSVLDGPLNVGPDVWRIVSVQVDELLWINVD